jgi:chromatin remodeling complex protein RSC6
MNEYVTEKGLKNGQNINLDASLKSLLDPPADVQVTFLNIQKYINKHYIKVEKDAEAPKTPKTPKAKEAPETKEAPAAKRPTVKKA